MRPRRLAVLALLAALWGCGCERSAPEGERPAKPPPVADPKRVEALRHAERDVAGGLWETAQRKLEPLAAAEDFARRDEAVVLLAECYARSGREGKLASLDGLWRFDRLFPRSTHLSEAYFWRGLSQIGKEKASGKKLAGEKLTEKERLKEEGKRERALRRAEGELEKALGVAEESGTEEGAKSTQVPEKVQREAPYYLALARLRLAEIERRRSLLAGRGRLRLAAKGPRVGLESYLKSFPAGPHADAATVLLGRCYHELDLFDEAVKHLTDYARRDPPPPALFRARALYWAAESRYLQLDYGRRDAGAPGAAGTEGGKSNWQAAQELYRRTAAAAEKAGEAGLLARARYGLGWALAKDAEGGAASLTEKEAAERRTRLLKEAAAALEPVARAPETSLALAGAVRRGRCLVELGRHEEALEGLRPALEEARWAVEAGYWSGRAFAELGRHEEALARFDAALEALRASMAGGAAAGAAGRALTRREVELLLAKARSAFALERWEAAAGDYERAEKKATGSTARARARLGLARASLKRHRHDRALQSMERLMRTPGMREALSEDEIFFRLAEIHEAVGLERLPDASGAPEGREAPATLGEEAARTFARAEKDLDSGEQERVERALAAYTRLLEENRLPPLERGRALLHRADCLSRLGRPQEVQRAYVAVLREGTDEKTRAKAREEWNGFRRKYLADAAEWYLKANGAKPSGPLAFEALLGAARTRALAGPPGAALRIFDRALERPDLAPADRARAELGRAECLRAAGRRGRCLVALDHALAAAATDDLRERALCLRAEVLERAERHREAAEAWRRAAALSAGRERTCARARAAQAELFAGRPGKAAELYALIAREAKEKEARAVALLFAGELAAISRDEPGTLRLLGRAAAAGVPHVTRLSRLAAAEIHLASAKPRSEEARALATSAFETPDAAGAERAEAALLRGEALLAARRIEETVKALDAVRGPGLAGSGSEGAPAAALERLSELLSEDRPLEAAGLVAQILGLAALRRPAEAARRLSRLEPGVRALRDGGTAARREALLQMGALFTARATELEERTSMGLGRALKAQADAEGDEERRRALLERALDEFLRVERRRTVRAKEAAALAAECHRRLSLESEARRLLEKHGLPRALDAPGPME